MLTVVADDQGNTGSGGPQTDTETIAITVNEFNDPPTITAPASAGVTEDVSTAVNGISISDPDANPATDSVLMNMSVNQGTMTLGNTSGLSFNIGDGTADGTMQFTGTINNINTALGTLTYLTASNATTNATLTLDMNDQGFTGSPGAQDAPQKLVTLTIGGVNDGPIDHGSRRPGYVRRYSHDVHRRHADLRRRPRTQAATRSRSRWASRMEPSHSTARAA